VYLLHVSSGVQLNVRPFEVPEHLSTVNVEDVFAPYARLSWAGTVRTHCFSAGGLRGIEGVFESAMPNAVVREWMVTDGRRLANAATFATEDQWKSILDECEELVRSIRFEQIPVARGWLTARCSGRRLRAAAERGIVSQTGID